MKIVIQVALGGSACATNHQSKVGTCLEAVRLKNEGI